MALLIATVVLFIADGSMAVGFVCGGVLAADVDCVLLSGDELR